MESLNVTGSISCTDYILLCRIEWERRGSESKRSRGDKGEFSPVTVNGSLVPTFGPSVGPEEGVGRGYRLVVVGYR